MWVFLHFFHRLLPKSTQYSIYTSKPLQIHLEISILLNSSFITYISSKLFMDYSQNKSIMGHNPYINQIQGFVRVCSNPNSFTLQLKHESNLEGRIPCFSCTICGFTHLTFNNFWVMMKFYQTLGLGQATNHAIVWKFIQEFIVPYLCSSFLLLFSSSSLPLPLFLLPFSSLFYVFFGSSQMRPNLVLNKMSFLKPCLAPKNPFFFGLSFHYFTLVLWFFSFCKSS